ncbi:MAG: DeoR/GlpR family DNA-binding transcription regulator [Tissierellia bacterium]|nr:DeoR/GlpR family DNA-binding transcription regulator [Tissierellia bacterium]
MKNKKTIVEQRQDEILKKINHHGQVTVNEMSNFFDVSNLTIRRDLDKLALIGEVERFHGGARKLKNNIKKENKILDAKKNAIAKKAAEFIEDGDTVFLNSSSTARLCLKYIESENVTIITNNAKTLYTDRANGINLILTGGLISVPKETLTGEFALSNLEKVIASCCIMGCSGLSINGGITTSNLEESTVNKTMIKNTSGEKIIITDSSKIGHNHTFLSCNINEISTIITDSDIDTKSVAALEKIGIKVILVEY